MPAEGPFLAIAHRYGNSLSALARAEAAGADLVEADVWRYHGRLEVRHSKTMGPAPLLWDRWSLEPAWRPRLGLDALVRAADPGTELMLDLKGRDPAIAGDVIETMERVAPGRPYAVCSQGWALLAPFDPLAHVRVVHSVGNRGALQQVLRRLSGEAHHAISINQKFLDAATVRALRAAAPTVMTWPINTLAALERVKGWGVTGAISDRIEVVEAIVSVRGGAQRPG